jgi:hypothetical protein
VGTHSHCASVDSEEKVSKIRLLAPTLASRQYLNIVPKSLGCLICIKNSWGFEEQMGETSIDVANVQGIQRLIIKRHHEKLGWFYDLPVPEDRLGFGALKTGLLIFAHKTVMSSNFPPKNLSPFAREPSEKGVVAVVLLATSRACRAMHSAITVGLAEALLLIIFKISSSKRLSQRPS